MRIVTMSSEMQAVIEANPQMKSYLHTLYSIGRKATPRSWFYEHVPVEQLVKTVSELTRNQFSDPHKQALIDQVEKKNLDKFGEQGKVPPFISKEAKEVLDPLYEPSKYDSEDSLSKFFKYGRDFAQYLFGSQSLLSKTPKNFNSVVDDMQDRDTLSSNSGYLRFTRRSKVKDLEIKDAEAGIMDRPAILLYRHYHGKLRPVWMFPMSTNLLEYQFTQVIQNALRTSPNSKVRDHVAPWDGFEDVKKVITRTWKHGAPRGGDTTKMDANMRLGQTKLVYEIVKWLFQRKYWNQLWKVMRNVNEIELIVGPTKIVRGSHGLASGSGWTQLLETVLVMFILWYNKILVSQGIGDDFEFMKSLTAQQIVAMLNEFGLPANELKQSDLSWALDFLQRTFMEGFMSSENPLIMGAYYSLIRALNSLALPEKFHNPKEWNSDMYNARLYMILENCVDDPHFEEFVTWAVKGQKDSISFAKKSDSELQAIQKQAKLVPGLNPSYNQEKRRKPLSSFKSIKIARRL